MELKIVVFGVGRYFANRRKKLVAQMWQGDEIVAFIDNNADAIKSVNGMRVDKVERITEIDFDIVLLMSLKHMEMRKQLLGLGVDEEKIYDWQRYVSVGNRGRLKMYIGSPMSRGKKSILIVSNDLNYNGGAIAAIYAAMALRGRGYDVCLCASRVEEDFARKLVGRGLNVAVCPSLPYVGDEERYFMQKFDIAVANVYHTLPIACEMNRVVPTLWWIHEPNDKYDPALQEIRAKFSRYDTGSAMQKLRIYAVSEIAKRNFETIHPNRVDGILPYGIPDEAVAREASIKMPFVFAIIGGVITRKAQNVFLEAVREMKIPGHGEIEFWLIGGCGNDPYGREVREMARALPQVRMLGVMGRDDLRGAFREIDCVVCASLEDPLPIAVTEGMMHGKVCIATDATGSAEYIRDGVNGLVCEAGNVEALREKMEYERLFSMEAFADRLETALLETERGYSGEVD